MRVFGRSKKGEKVVRTLPKTGGKGVSVIPAIAWDGPIAVTVKEGSVKRKDFEAFLRFKVVSLPLHMRNSCVGTDAGFQLIFSYHV